MPNCRRRSRKECLCSRPPLSQGFCWGDGYVRIAVLSVGCWFGVGAWLWPGWVRRGCGGVLRRARVVRPERFVFGGTKPGSDRAAFRQVASSRRRVCLPGAAAGDPGGDVQDPAAERGDLAAGERGRPVNPIGGSSCG